MEIILLLFDDHYSIITFILTHANVYLDNIFILCIIVKFDFVVGQC